jgi:hypothetical protein
MHRHDDPPPSIPRRRILQASAAAALGWTFSPLAHARPTAGPAKSPSASPSSSSPSAGPSAQPAAPGPSGPTPSAVAAAPSLQRLPADPELSPEMKALGDVIADRVKHAIVAAAAHPTKTFAKGSYARVAHGYVARLPAKARSDAATKAAGLLAAPARQRRVKFGSMALAAAEDHDQPLKPLPPKLVADAQRVLKAKLQASAAGERVMSKMPYNRFGFFLNEVKCIEETDEIGADEIKLAAFLVSPDGRTKKRAFTVHDDFDAGEKKTYYPANDKKKFIAADPNRGKALATFAMNPDHFPGAYTLMLSLWEADQGGFQEAANELYAAIAEEARLAFQYAGYASGGPLGLAIYELTRYILKGVLTLLVQIFDNPDDHIDDFQASLSLWSPDASYFDGLSGRASATPASVWASKQFTVKFKGDGGYYRAKIHWRVWREGPRTNPTGISTG